MFKHIVFDVDGTLINTESAILDSLACTLQQIQNKAYTPQELEFVLGIPSNVSLPQLGVQDVKAAMELWYTCYNAMAGEVRLYEGILPLLEWLKAKGYKTGIVTSKSRMEYEADFPRFGIEQYFDVVRCAGDTPRGKPHPDPLESYCALSGAKPEEVLYIGDSVYDMQCAKAAGTAGGVAGWGAHERHEADYYFNTPAEVQALLAGQQK